MVMAKATATATASESASTSTSKKGERCKITPTITEKWKKNLRGKKKKRGERRKKDDDGDDDRQCTERSRQQVKENIFGRHSFQFSQRPKNRRSPAAYANHARTRVHPGHTYARTPAHYPRGSRSNPRNFLLSASPAALRPPFDRGSGACSNARRKSEIRENVHNVETSKEQKER